MRKLYVCHYFKEEVCSYIGKCHVLLIEGHKCVGIATRKRITAENKLEIVEAYTKKLEPAISIGFRYQRSRQAILKLLKREGVDTSNHLWEETCFACGKKIMKRRCELRGRNRHYCDMECYGAALEAGNGHPYIENRQGQRIARKIVVQWYPSLKKTDIVHHENRNTFINLKWNLKVFASRGDHVRHHRGILVEPLWDGNKE